MRWAVGVTTAPRPQSTLRQATKSLERAGFDAAHVFDDAGGCGAWPNWLRALRCLLRRCPDAEAILICQDDIVCCRELREYLDRTLWPGRAIALCSPYCPGPYRRAQTGWHEQRRGWALVGALCWALPRRAADAVLADLGEIRARSRIDARVGRWAARTRRTVWYHTPSLVQHIGNRNSALGDVHDTTLRRAVDFIGEDRMP